MELNKETLLEKDEEEESPIPLYGTCIKCKQARSHYQWCQQCERKQCKENFTNWTSGNEKIDKFLQISQLNSTRPQTFLEWIPFDRLENINILDVTSRTTVYSANWKYGPRILWDEQTEQYERKSTIQVIIKLYKDSDKDQINKILNELTIYLDCHALIFQFYGISKQPDSNDYFIVKQYAQNGSLHDYILKNRLSWEIKLHLLLYLAEDLKALHDAGYIHRYLHPFSILVFDSFCSIGTFSKCCKASSLPNTEEIIGWQHYIAPEYLRYKHYTKASDIYAFGMIMHTVGTGNIPHRLLFIDHYLTLDLCLGLRPNISDNIPKSFKDLVEKCWDTEPSLRPNIHEVYNTLLNMWSSIYRNKDLASLNSISLEFLAADNRNNRDYDYSKSDSHEVIPQKAENRGIVLIHMNELSEIENIGSHSGTILKATWKETNNFVICKRLTNNQSIINKPIEAFIHELNANRKLDFCSRIIRIFGLSFDENAQEYLLIMQYADGGNLRKYLKQNFSKLTWDNKIRFAYQITEGIKYLHEENILHQDLHSKNIVIHQGEVKIIDLGILGIAKSSETEAEMIPYIDPKCLEGHSYDKKSDIYSLGVLMWELSSGHPPFINNENETPLRNRLINGHREEPIPDTPNEYSELYKLCWDPKPNIRPSINQVFDKFEKMLNIQNKKYLDPAELIDIIIKHHIIKFINIDELTEMIPIGGGHFGTMSKATWKKTNNLVACKRLKNNQSISEKQKEAFLHELNMHRRLDFCARIIRILGINFDKNTQEYLMIMQYADGGDLRKYLKDHFSTLTQDDKIKLAYQITEGIKYLHGENILHRDLHSGNIVIHQGEAKITDLGIAKSAETETHLHSGVHGIISYIDPKLLEDFSYKYNKKSDIYSLGVLMWELFSGRPPFSNSENEKVLKIHLIDGLREDLIPGTPDEYSKLYKLCWDSEPNVRPTIDKVFIKLVKLGKMLGIQVMLDIQVDDDDDDIKDSKSEANVKPTTIMTDGDDLIFPSDDDD